MSLLIWICGAAVAAAIFALWKLSKIDIEIGAPSDHPSEYPICDDLWLARLLHSSDTLLPAQGKPEGDTEEASR